MAAQRSVADPAHCRHRGCQRRTRGRHGHRRTATKLQRFEQLDRIDILLTDSASHSQVGAALHALPAWQGQILIQQPSDDQQRVGEMSRAYRVNLTVLALVALFTGAFLVFSVLALSVAQRAPQFALLAVLGATPRQRMALVLLEASVLGLIGSAAGIALGSLLAWLALQMLGGDLGGGFLPVCSPRCNGALWPRWCSACSVLQPRWQEPGGPRARPWICRLQPPSRVWVAATS